MKFTMTTLLAAALATVSFAQLETKPLPARFTLKFTSISTGADLGSLILDKVYASKFAASYICRFTPCS